MPRGSRRPGQERRGGPLGGSARATTADLPGLRSAEWNSHYVSDPRRVTRGSRQAGLRCAV